LLIAIGAGFLTTCLSALIGISTGFIGGVYDTVMMRLVDALLAIPMVVVLIVTAAFLKPNITILIILISLLHWPGGARVLRSQTLSLKSRLHILAAETFGAGKLYRIRRHIIPELGPLLVVSFLYSARAAVFMEAGLAFIGLADPSMISWGTMMHHASKFYYLSVWKWWLLPPGFTLSLLMLSFTFLGYSLERIMEPRLKNA
jgi:peptide/nickel transport system permease protein